MLSNIEYESHLELAKCNRVQILGIRFSVADIGLEMMDFDEYLSTRVCKSLEPQVCIYLHVKSDRVNTRLVPATRDYIEILHFSEPNSSEQCEERRTNLILHLAITAAIACQCRCSAASKSAEAGGDEIGEDEEI